MFDSAGNKVPKVEIPKVSKEHHPGIRGLLLARLLRARQEKLMFDPLSVYPYAPGPKLAQLQHPNAYPELAPYGFRERILNTGAPPYPGKATMTLWEKTAKPGMPHVITFFGRSGHWADIGPIVHPHPGDSRQVGLQVLEAIAKSGAGITAVTPRGYGNNVGTPGEAEFRQDIGVLADDWMERDDRPAACRLIIFGCSLGSAVPPSPQPYLPIAAKFPP